MATNTETTAGEGLENKMPACLATKGTSVSHASSQGPGIFSAEQTERFYEPEAMDYVRKRCFLDMAG